MTIVWSARAIEHLTHLRSYVARDNPSAADGSAGTLLDAVQRLAELPNLGGPGRVSGTRELVVPGTPYVTLYRLRGERLVVIAVFHGRQKCPSICDQHAVFLGIAGRRRMASGRRTR